MRNGFSLIHKDDLVRQIDAIALVYRNKPDALEALSILRVIFEPSTTVHLTSACSRIATAPLFEQGLLLE